VVERSIALEAAPSPSSVLGTIVSGAVEASVAVAVGSLWSGDAAVARATPTAPAPAPLPLPLPLNDPLGFGGIRMCKVECAGLQESFKLGGSGI
jgi:hypothetical protein